jgi:hypothetical protein
MKLTHESKKRSRELRAPDLMITNGFMQRRRWQFLEARSFRFIEYLFCNQQKENASGTAWSLSNCSWPFFTTIKIVVIAQALGFHFSTPPCRWYRPPTTASATNAEVSFWGERTLETPNESNAFLQLGTALLLEHQESRNDYETTPRRKKKNEIVKALVHELSFHSSDSSHNFRTLPRSLALFS